MLYGVDGQLLWVFAFNDAGYVEDDQSNITGSITLDDGTPQMLGNPTQAPTKRGDYYYTLTAEQSRGRSLKSFLASTTPGVQVKGTPDPIYIERYNVLPLSGSQARSAPTSITLFVGEAPVVQIQCFDSSGLEVDLTGRDLTLVVENNFGFDIATISPVVAGSFFSFVPTPQMVAKRQTLSWALRDNADDSVLMYGPIFVKYAAKVD